jgi:hypothetical protein
MKGPGGGSAFVGYILDAGKKTALHCLALVWARC